MGKGAKSSGIGNFETTNKSNGMLGGHSSQGKVHTQAQEGRKEGDGASANTGQEAASEG